ncbi:flavin-containing monooxygenase 5-like isoform X1 [Oncorhynchus clarkii lewisi]|uniref:flavin-containing monooxygenase 5-like isoform X1 n=1 Tax=Oncorhynchus clarkii lewisi TaxID=490388 RepID=UPI0039B85A4A
MLSSIMVCIVAVIGAGPSGLTSIKSCLDEGLEPTCFESSDDIGGLWRFKEHPDPGRANIYQSVIINSSKEMMSYSDFPPPAHLPNNMHQPQLLSYLRLYAQTFDLFKHIYFQVYLSTRKGAWVVSRVGAGGLPGDLVGTSRLDRLVQKLFPSWITMMMEKKLNRTFDHRLYGLQPKHRFFAQIPVVNDDLPGRIISGRVLVKPNIREIKGSSVVFEDGSVMEKVDVVVFATGYNYDFPFLPSGLLTHGGHRLCLYRYVFPPRLARPSLAVVGFICNLGAINPLAEMQARWATQVFKGLLTLASQEAMLQDVKRDTSTLQNRFACLERHPLQVDHIPYMDSMAEELGVRPNLLGLLLREPGVGLRVLLGPCTPYQYRLRGPGQWDGARQAILTQWERVAQPFRTRMPPQPESRTRASSSLILTLSVTVLLLTTFYTRHSLSSLHTGLLYKIYSLPEIIWGWK